MKIGADRLVIAWGRTARFYREGVLGATVKARKVRSRPSENQVVASYSENEFTFIVAVSQMGAFRPHKYDTIEYEGDTYSVQQSITTGADEDELIRVLASGGIV